MRSNRFHRLAFAAASAVVISAVIAVVAAGHSAPAHAGSFTRAASEATPYHPNDFIAGLAEKAGLAPQALESLISTGSELHSEWFIVGENASGVACFTVAYGDPASVADPFRCESANSDRGPLRVWAVPSGASGSGLANQLVVIGSVEKDVARVAAVLQDGRTLDIPITSDDVFAYAASNQKDLARAFDAYDASGSLVAHVAVDLTN